MTTDPQMAGDFHTKEGWWFGRLEDGSVGITKTNERAEIIEHQVVLAPNEWASVVAFVSTKGDNAESFDEALRFHSGATGQDAEIRDLRESLLLQEAEARENATGAVNQHHWKRKAFHWLNDLHDTEDRLSQREDLIQRLRARAQECIEELASTPGRHYESLATKYFTDLCEIIGPAALTEDPTPSEPVLPELTPLDGFTIKDVTDVLHPKQREWMFKTLHHMAVKRRTTPFPSKPLSGPSETED
ncbi:MAG: hypothetical protein GEU73_05050 [Chloroflexi bacterium]|nr:hypothetical protein [Chloroflexota bacterium]